MGKSSIYSKTRSQLRQDLAQVVKTSKAKPEIETPPDLLDAGEDDTKECDDGKEDG